MKDESSSGVMEHPLAAMLLLGVCACGAFVLHAVPARFGLDRGMFHHAQGVQFALVLGIAAAVAFPVYVARPLLAAALPVWGRVAVWSLYGVAAFAAYAPELPHHGRHAHAAYFIRIENDRVHSQMAVPPVVDALRDMESDGSFPGDLEPSTVVSGADGDCAVVTRSVQGAVDRIGGPNEVTIRQDADDEGSVTVIERTSTAAGAGKLKESAEGADGRCVVIVRSHGHGHGRAHFTLPPGVPQF